MSLLSHSILPRAVLLAGAVALASPPGSASAQQAPSPSRQFTGTPFTYVAGNNTHSAAIEVTENFPVQSLSLSLGLMDMTSEDVQFTLTFVPFGASNNQNFTLFSYLGTAPTRPVRSFDGEYVFTTHPDGAPFPASQSGLISPGAYFASNLTHLIGKNSAGRYTLTVTAIDRANGGGEVTGFGMEFNASPTTVPEPATAALLAPILLAGVAFARRRSSARPGA